MARESWRNLPLNGLRVFEAAARRQSFARAADELLVTPAAVSHHVKKLEDQLGYPLFRRLPQGLLLTEEGRALLPRLQEAFERIGGALAEVSAARRPGAVTVSCIGTFAVGWLLPRLQAFEAAGAGVQVELYTHNNWKVSALAESDLYVRYGDGAWEGFEATRLLEGVSAPLCAPVLAERLAEPRDVLDHPRFATYHDEEWPNWLAAAGVADTGRPRVVFDSTRVMINAVLEGRGVGIGTPSLFGFDIEGGRLVQPFALTIPTGKAYCLVRAAAGPRSAAAEAVWTWLRAEGVAPRQA